MYPMFFMFLWLVLKFSKGDSHRNCSDGTDMTITAYSIYKGGNYSYGDNDAGFNVSYRNHEVERTCLIDPYNSEQCQSYSGVPYTVFEKLHWKEGQKAQPKLNVSFDFTFKISYKNGTYFYCKYRPPEFPALTMFRNDTNYPKPKIFVDEVDSGVYVSWSLDNIREFSKQGTRLELHMKFNGNELNVETSQLSTFIRDPFDEGRNSTITAYFEDQYGRTGLENYIGMRNEKHVKVSVAENNNSASERIAWIVLIGVGCLSVIAVTICVYYCRRRRQKATSHHHQVGSDLANTINWHSEYNPMYYIEPTRVMDPFERVIRSSELKHVKRLGEGNYGQVNLYRWFAQQQPKGQLVAVKTFKDIRDLSQYKNELDIFRKVGLHPNIVEFIGSSTELPWFIVTEYMEKGDLASYLRSLRSDFKDWTQMKHEESQALHSHAVNVMLTGKDLEYFGKEIASGMAHLEQCQVVHRDLAARNILLGGNKSVKITDFGLSRQGLYSNASSKSQLPVRWMAPETFMSDPYVCSSKSDVWSFAVVLWEIGTLGAVPYENMDQHQMRMFLIENRRLSQPELIRNSLYDLMLQCWSSNSDDRPNFRQILSQIESMSAYFEFTDLQPSYQFPPTFDD